MDEENRFNESDSEEEESYSFMRETVKKRPLRFSRILLKALMFLGAGALFGAAAAFVFLHAIKVNAVPSNISEEATVQSESAEQTELIEQAEPTEQAEATDQAEPTEETEPTEATELTEVIEPTEQAEPTEQTEPTAQVDQAEQLEAEVTDMKPTEEPVEEEAREEQVEGTTGIPGEEGPGENSAEAEEKLNAEALNEYKRLNEAIRGVAEEAGKSLVQVTGITDSVDWFSNINSASQTGSGVIIREANDRLMILTYRNLVADAGRVVVTMKDQSVRAALVVGSDPVTNLAVVSVPFDRESDREEMEWAAVNIADSAEVRTGDSVIAIGNPLGYSNSVVYGEVTSTSGHVSLTDSEYGLITTNCVGSSQGSGILVDLNGQIVGCIMQQYSDEKWPLITAVPSSLLKDIADRLSDGKVPGYVGLKGESVTVQVAEGIDVPAGVYITEVEPDSPALAAGIMPGDVLTKIGDLEIADMQTVSECVLEAGPNQELEFTVLRRGAEKDVEFSFTVTVGELS